MTLKDEQEAREKRIEDARADLRAACGKLPFNLNEADATRIDVWKTLHAKAMSMLGRNVREPSRYEDMARRIRACGEASLASLVEGVYRDNENPRP